MKVAVGGGFPLLRLRPLSAGENVVVVTPLRAVDGSIDKTYLSKDVIVAVAARVGRLVGGGRIKFDFVVVLDRVESREFPPLLPGKR